MFWHSFYKLEEINKGACSAPLLTFTSQLAAPMMRLFAAVSG
jgi:hypothetical protein